MKKQILMLFGLSAAIGAASDVQENLIFYEYNERVAKTRGFGGWSIAQELFDHIRLILPEGSALLELGSGWVSGEFSKYYTVYSIEHDMNFLNKYNTNYIYAPIIKSWYDHRILAKQLPKKYDMILVDGPLGRIGRYDFLTHINLFRKDVPIIIDDVNRPAENKLLMDLVSQLKRKYEIFTIGRRQYAIVYP